MYSMKSHSNVFKPCQYSFDPEDLECLKEINTLQEHLLLHGYIFHDLCLPLIPWHRILVSLSVGRV